MHILWIFMPNTLLPRNTYIRRVFLIKLAEVHSELKIGKNKQREEF